MSTKGKRKVRFTVGLTPEQAVRLEELNRIRSRKGQPTSRADLVREAVGFYLQHQPDLVGSRKAIAKDLESKIDTLNTNFEELRTQLTAFIERVTSRRPGN